MTEELRKEIEEARKIRHQAERETEEMAEATRNDFVPMWKRLGIRRIQNSFGEEYEISLQVRGNK